MMPGVSSERRFPLNRNAPSDQTPKLFCERPGGAPRPVGNELNQVEFVVCVQELVARGAHWLVELEELTRLRRVALGDGSAGTVLSDRFTFLR